MIRPALALALLLSTAASAQITAIGNLGAGTTTWSGTVTVTGDVTIPSGGTLIIQPGTVVTSNATDLQGSGEVTTKPELLVFGVLNVSGVSGGGVVFTGAGTGTTAWGGIVVRAGGSATISYTTFDEMSAGIKAQQGATGVITNLTISNSSISGSDYGLRTTATGSGGTLTTTLNGVTVNGCVQSALDHQAGAVNVTDSSFSGSTASNVILQSAGTLWMTTSRVTNNTYGIYIAGGTSTSIDRCTISYNTASDGISTFVSSGAVTIASSIISHNGGDGVRRGNLGTISVTSSNVWGNSNAFGPPPTSAANTASANFFGTITQSNNKSENPLFVDAVARNYRLSSRSGSRNSGVSNVDQGALPYVADATAGLQGTLWNDLTLSGGNAVLGDLTIAPGVTLTLSPGATLTFAASDSVGAGNLAAGSELIVLGTLTAIGVSGSPISLTGAGTGSSAWGGIVVRAGGSATIANAAIDELSAGIIAELGATGINTSLTISNSSISGSQYGLRTAASGSGGSLTTTLNGVTVNGCVQSALDHQAGAVNVTDSSFSGSAASNVILQSAGTLWMTTSRVTNNTYGIYIAGGTSTSIDRCTISYNTASDGVSTFVSSGTVTITSSIISHNGGDGVRRGNLGTISVTSSNVWGNSNAFGPPPTSAANTASANFFGTITQSNNKSENPLFVDAVARNYRLTSRSGSRSSGVSNVDQGALPYVSDATVGLEGTLWTNTTLSGANPVLGDLTVAPGVTLTLSPGATLTFAASDSVGAGNLAAGSELLVLGTLTAIGVSGSPITLTGAGTGTSAWAGLVLRAGGSTTLANVALDEMSAGIVAAVGTTGVTTTLTMSNATVSGSQYGLRTTASGSGGTGTFNVSSSSFSGCVQSAIDHQAGDLSVQTTSLSGSTASNVVLQSAGTMRLERTLVANNTYGVYISGGTSSVFDRCTVSYNTASDGISTFVSSGTVTITSSIISHNGGDGVRRGNLGTISVTSSDVWGNSNTFGPPPTAAANTAAANYFGTITQVNNISENPLFANEALRNYTLQSTSPARGAGVSGVDQGAFPYTVGAVTTVSVTPSTATVAAGGVVGFSAQARDATGNIVSNETFTWTASSPAGTMTTTGVLTASCTPGTYTGAVTARTANGTTGSATVVVNLGSPSQIVISPTAAMVKSQATQQYTGVVRDSCNNTITGQTINWGANATAGNITTGGLFTASCTRGSYPGGITATAGSLTASTGMSVIAGDPAAIGITPLMVSVAAGATQQFAASVADGCGNTVSSAVTWSTSVTGGMINSTGLFTAGQSNGTFAAGVTATAGTRMASAEVTVTGGSGGSVASVTVAPLTASLAPNATQTLVASARDSGGVVLTGLPVTWAVTAGGGSISTGGVFTAGTVAATFTDTISATVGGVTGRASVTVQPGAVSTVTVAPTTVTLAPSGTANFTATARDAFSNTVTGAVTWSASSSAGTITAGGVFTAGVSPGNYPASVTATVGTVSGTAAVIIQNGALSQLLVMPAATQLAAGASVAFSASGRDSGGATVAVTPTWTVVAGGGAITSAGLFTAGTTAGTFPNTVRAEANGLTAFASVSVTPGPVLSVVVTPMMATVQANGSQQFTAEARDAFSNVVPTGFMWTAQPAAGAITQGGFFTASSSAGSFPNSVTAAVGTITGFASVAVTGSGTGGGGGATGGGTGGGATGGGTGGGATGGGGGSDMDGGTGGGTAGGSGGGGEITGGGTGGGGGTVPTGCSCNSAEGALPFLAFGLLALSRRRRGGR